MNIQHDFKELLGFLEKHKVDYMIIGDYAVAFHGYPRFTKDIDIFFFNSKGNIDKIIKALEEFGFSKKELKGAMFASAENIVTFGVAPIRVDFLNQIDGVEFSEARKERVRGKYGDIDVFFIGREHLLKNKQSTPRAKDKIDVDELS